MLREDYAIWRCGKHEISLARPRIMGILNVTPDSFSDGGDHDTREAAVEWGLRMLDDGADIIDVGGESTRPGFEGVSSQEEAKRVVPVVRDLVEAGAIVSVDTRHADVAKMCVRLGASIVNDVTGFTDPKMVQMAADTSCGCVIMHAGEVSGGGTRRQVMLDSNPKAKATTEKTADAAAKAEVDDDVAQTVEANEKAAAQLEEVMSRSSRGVESPTVRLSSGNRHFTLPEEAPIMRRVMGFLGDQARTVMRAGVDHDRICIDPGAGFGKYADEDVVIQRATSKMVSMGYPLMCAVSRKRFVGSVSGVSEACGRDDATIGMVLAAAEAGARILRVHDVAGLSQALDSYWSVAHPDPRRAFLSLGSNVGDRIGYLGKACALIDSIPLTCVVGVSHAYETDPAYGIAKPVANCVVEIRTELAPLVLLDSLLAVEDQLGRERVAGQEGHGPRTIDVDLAWMEGETHAGRRLTLPHRGLGERDYVIVPLEDLMHDPVRFLEHGGVKVKPQDERVGLVRSDLGEVAWE
ncbi:MAG: dihydropteroate synthase [Atopobiaceae bacterium]|jgi:2-amino-4-hydroxy-6-hydroxymethyldihydropteridine diphosphokinase|nr:dihydropteroate synthase [Atopobiaceae bacterium]MCI2173578.1 dihydropteroate synthase [Atopobiaceae bacterium]MCI2207780.1 dihydropteroate synthase [Atopobiaceae bacterium]